MATRTLLGWVVLSLSTVLAAAALEPSVARAQDDGRLLTVDEDLGLKLRHPQAARPGQGRLRIGNSGRLSPGRANQVEPSRQSREAEPRWQYHWFDHPKPSYQYFSQPRTYIWRYDSYPGFRSYPEPNNSYFYYYDYPPAPYYYPPADYWRYGPGGWYGW
jgi:hypothetical protein